MEMEEYHDENKMKKKLKEMAEEMAEEASKVVDGYKENPSDASGSYVNVHESSPYLKEEFTGDSWKKIIYSSDMDKLLKDVEKHNENVKKKNVD